MHAISLIVDMDLYIVFFEFVFIQVKVYEVCRVGVEDLTHIYGATVRTAMLTNMSTWTLRIARESRCFVSFS